MFLYYGSSAKHCVSGTTMNFQLMAYYCATSFFIRYLVVCESNATALLNEDELGWLCGMSIFVCRHTLFTSKNMFALLM